MILLLGYGISNKEVAKYLDKNKIEYVIHDDKKDVINENILNKVTLVIKSPGVNNDHPLIILASKKNIEIINEIEYAYRINNKGIIIGLTGSNGKTSTLYYLYQLLKLGYEDVILIGNNGIPYISAIDKIKDSTIILLELSSFQLMDISTFKVDIGCILNITLNHLDYHNSFNEYKLAKYNLLKNNDENTISIIDNSLDIENLKGFLYKFSNKRINGYYYKNNKIYYKNKKIMEYPTNLKMVGEHNKLNLMIAIIIAMFLGIEKKIIIDNLSNIKGVKYRLEFLKSIGNIDIFNDGKSSTPSSTKTAIECFNNRRIHLILGGKDKNMDYSVIKDYANVIYYAYGEIKDKLKGFKNINFFENLTDAYKNINAKNDDVILFSPAATSFDQYTSYLDRCIEFERLVINDE